MSFKPGSPIPWKAYGDVRGLKAPARIIFAPALATDSAMVWICSRDSTEHGPAATTTSGPPTFKPRTSPYAFQGMGEPGLKLMREAADKFGLFTVSEVMDP